MSSPLHVVHFSDLHFCGSPGEGYYRWALGRAADLKPDAFVFTGDLIDDPELIPMALDCLKSLVSVAPCYFILGNHDWRHDYESLRSALSDTGWNDLGGQSCVHEIAGRRVFLSGCEYPWIGPQPLPAHDVDCDLRILLSHSPDQFRAAIRAGYDVMFSGHTHGGQVILPVIGPVYSPSLHGVRFASGLFQVGRLGIHVSRGMGAKDCLRLRCRPELTSVRIMGTGPHVTHTRPASK